MKFTELALKGAYLLEIEPVEDERGFLLDPGVLKSLESWGLQQILFNLIYPITGTRGF